MKNFKRFIIFYLLGIASYIIISLAFIEYVPIKLKNWGVFVFILFFTILGYILSIRSNDYNPKKSKDVPLVGYIVALSAVIILFLSMDFMQWYHEKYEANSEMNKSAMDNLAPDDADVIKMAFKKLESNFQSPNDFRLHSTSSDIKDTIINNESLVLNIIYFTYFIGHDFEQEYKSNILVFNKAAIIVDFNKKVINGLRIPSPKIFYDKKTIDTLKKYMKNWPDSMK